MNTNNSLGYKPIIIKNDKLVKEFLKKNPSTIYVDAFSCQLKELFFIKNNKFIGEKKGEVFKNNFFLNFIEKNNILWNTSSFR